MAETVLRMTDICKSYSGVQVLKNVSVEFSKGEIHALVGENGAGKTTLMNILGAVIDYDGGSIEVNGEIVHIHNPSESQALGIAFIHQELNVVNDLMVYENMFSEIKLPDEIKNIVKDRFAATVPTQLNARNGATTIAAASILNHNDSFIFEGLHAATTYLYIFDNGYNFMVTFVPKGDNIVNASVNAVIDDDIGNCTNAEEIVKFFRDKLSFESVSVSMAAEEK